MKLVAVCSVCWPISLLMFYDKKQMAVVLHYVDKFGAIKERRIGVVHVNETLASCL